MSDPAITAAREALAPIRGLHRPRRKMHTTICDECRRYWPCPTARHCCTTEELEGANHE